LFLFSSSRPTTPQTAPVINTRRKPTSITDQSPPSNTITPKRGRKPTKLATPNEQSPEKQTSTNNRPVRIALSSHLVRIQFLFYLSYLFIFLLRISIKII